MLTRPSLRTLFLSPPCSRGLASVICSCLLRSRLRTLLLSFSSNEFTSFLVSFAVLIVASQLLRTHCRVSFCYLFTRTINTSCSSRSRPPPPLFYLPSVLQTPHLCTPLRSSALNMCVLMRPAGPVHPGEPRGTKSSRTQLRVQTSWRFFGLSPDVNACSQCV